MRTIKIKVKESVGRCKEESIFFYGYTNSFYTIIRTPKSKSLILMLGT